MTTPRRAPALALALCLFACHRGGEEEAPAPVVTADVASARVSPFPVAIQALGTVAPRPGRFAQLAAPAEARVRRIYVAVGDRVAAGAPLVAFDSAVWEADVRRAETAAQAARSANDRTSRLAEQGILPRKDAEQAAADLAAAEADLADAHRTLSLAVLRAPIAGVVSRMTARLEASVEPSVPLVEIIDPDALEVVFHLAPRDAARMRRGDLVRFDADTTATGRVAGIDAAIDSTGGVVVRARMDGAPRAWAGETVAGSIVVDVHENAVVVPLAALVPDGSRVQVFVVGPDSIAHARSVVVGGRSEDEAEVVRGLRGGESVVTEGAYGVQDGAKIRRRHP